MAQFEPVLTRYVKEPGCFTLDFYVQHGGYERTVDFQHLHGQLDQVAQ